MLNLIGKAFKKDEMERIPNDRYQNLGNQLGDEKLFIAILENVNSGVALIDETGQFILYNKRFLNLFGLSEESTIKNVNDQNWSDWEVFNENLEILHVDDHPVRKAAITGSNVTNQLVAVRLPSGGDLIWMLISAEPIFRHGKVEMTICTYTNITEHKLADVALRKSEQNLRELNATKDKFFSIIAHDLKSPFTSIIGFTELLTEKIKKNDYEGIEEFADIIHKSSWRAMDLLSNLIEWSRMQTGRMEFNPQKIDMILTINKVTDLLKDSADQKSITIIQEVPSSLNVIADKSMISTVLRNLISNSIKFTNQDGKIKISSFQDDGKVTVVVEDNGKGIEEEIQEKMFRIDNSFSTPGTNGEAGTGLGLLLCKEFIAKHGGRIWVESTFSEGSKFFFTLPRKRI